MVCFRRLEVQPDSFRKTPRQTGTGRCFPRNQFIKGWNGMMPAAGRKNTGIQKYHTDQCGKNQINNPVRPACSLVTCVSQQEWYLQVPP